MFNDGFYWKTEVTQRAAGLRKKWVVLDSKTWKSSVELRSWSWFSFVFCWCFYVIEGQISFRSASGLHVPPFIVYPGLWDSLGVVLSWSWLCLVLPWSGSCIGLSPLKARSCLDLNILHSWSWLGPKPSKSWCCLGPKTRPMAFVVSVSTNQGLGLVSISIHSGLCLDLVWNLQSLCHSRSRPQPRQSLGLVSIAIHFWSWSGQNLKVLVLSRYGYTSGLGHEFVSLSALPFAIFFHSCTKHFSLPSHFPNCPLLCLPVSF